MRRAEFRPLLATGTRLLPSRRAGLGASLYDAAADLLAAGYGAVCLINSDSPTLPTSVLVDAARALSAPGDRRRPRPGGGRRLLPDRPEAGACAACSRTSPGARRRSSRRPSSGRREIGLEPVVLPVWYDVDDIAVAASA